MTTILLTAPDISCERCKTNIESDLSALAGIRRVEVAVDTKRVAVDYDDAVVGADAVRQQLTESGYPPAP